MRYKQNEAVQVGVYRSEAEVQREVSENLRQVNDLERRIKGKLIERSYHRNGPEKERKKFMDTVRSVPMRVVAWQGKNCK